MQDWFIAPGQGPRLGPLSLDEVKASIARGEIAPDSLAWRAGMADWVRADATDLADLFADQPPPLPDRSPGPAPITAPDLSRPGLAAPPRGFLEAIRTCLSNYATFRGRASRSEFWYWTLFAWLVNMVASALDGASQSQGEVGLIGGILSLAVLLPSLAVGARRLHDIGRSGWWQLIGIVPLIGWIVLVVWFATPGTRERTVHDRDGQGQAD